MIPEKLKSSAYWCVSKDKVPLDIYVLPKGYEWGASSKRSHSSYGVYDTAKQISEDYKLPICLFVKSEIHHIYIVDIEKTCPKEIRKAILNALASNIVYLEYSLSGKGFHLIVKDVFDKITSAKYKKWFEILSNHHCTFTQNEVNMQTALNVTFDTNEEIQDDDDKELLAELAKDITPMDFYKLIGNEAIFVQTHDDSFEKYKKVCSNFDGRHADLFNDLCNIIYLKKLEDFNNDYSKYEFGYCSTLHYSLQRYRQNMKDCYGNNYELPMSREEAIMLVYMVMKQSLPYREKHDSARVGLPWLLYTSQMVYDKTFSSNQEGG